MIATAAGATGSDAGGGGGGAGGAAGAASFAAPMTVSFILPNRLVVGAESAAFFASLTVPPPYGVFTMYTLTPSHVSLAMRTPCGLSFVNE